MAFFVNADPAFSDGILRSLDEFRQSGICVDIKLVAESGVDNEPINFLQCHRCVLAAASPFFRGLFSSDMRESSESVVTLHGISFRTLQQLVDFIYTGKTHPLTDSECIALLTAGGYLAMDELISACAKVLGNAINVNNCLMVEAAAEACNCFWLVHAARQFALANFEAVCHTAEFLDLEHQRLIWYIRAYAESAMGVGSDHVLDGCDTVYRALGKWTAHQESSMLADSSDSVSSLLRECPVCSSNGAEKLDPQMCTCRSAVEPTNSESSNPTVQKLFAQLLSFSIIDSSPSTANHAVSSSHFKRSSQQIGVLIVACGRSPRVWAFSQKRNSWLALPMLPASIRKASLASLAGSLYVIGGCVNGVLTDSVWRLDVLPASWHLVRQPADARPVARWVPVKPLPCARAGHAVASIGDRFIAVLGGYGQNGLLDSIVCYDRITDTWMESGRSASVPRIGARLAVIANYNTSERSRHSSSSSSASEKMPSHQLPASWTLLEVGGLQAGGRLSVIDCYSVVCSSSCSPVSNPSVAGHNNSSETSLMPDNIAISFSGEQLLLPQPVRFAEPAVLNEGSMYDRYGDISSRLVVVCSDFENPATGSDAPYCFVLSFDLHRRICRMVSSSLPNGTRVRPAVARTSDGSSIFVVGGRTFSSSSPLLEPLNRDDNVDPPPSNNFRPVATVEMFEEETREWKRLSDIPESRSGHCSSLLLFVNN